MYMHTYIDVYEYAYKYMYICTVYIQKTELTENNFHVFAANGNGKRKFVFLGWQKVKSNRRLLFQMCPSIVCF